MRYVMHLLRKPDGRWHLQHLGRTLAVFETPIEGQQVAEQRAHALCDTGHDVALTLHRADGAVEREEIFSAHRHT